jgi:hypothetical protein
MDISPFAKLIQNRHECFPVLTQTVFDFGRNLRIFPADDQSVCLQLMKTLAEGFE